MSDARERTLGETLNTWVQIIAIIVAAAWGVYTFVYKEIKVPKSAPINITMNLQLKKVGTRNVKKPLVAVEMRVSATNPSSRKVYLLPSALIVYGLRLASAEAIPDFNKLSAARISAQDGDYIMRHAAYRSTTIVAAGSLFPDEWLNPNETLMRTVIFYVPREEYDSVEAHTIVASVDIENKVELEWTIDDSGSLVPSLYAVGERKPIKKEEEGSYGYQQASSSAELSLWE